MRLNGEKDTIEIPQRFVAEFGSTSLLSPLLLSFAFHFAFHVAVEFWSRRKKKKVKKTLSTFKINGEI